MRIGHNIAVSAVLLAFGLCLLAMINSVQAETEPNNGQHDAQKLLSGDTETGSITGSDNEDWYYIELAPYQTVKVTIELTSSSGGVWVYEIFEDDETGGVYININVDPSYKVGDDSYKNDELSTIKLFLRVGGDGDYKIGVDLSGGAVCCSWFLVWGVVPLLVFFLAVLVMVEKIGPR